MHRDRQHQSGNKSERQPGRREWEGHPGERHQMEAREHARQPDKAHLTHELRSAEAARQIRELRARF
ncbi:MAG TPA: hypothetical protein VIP10_04135 [Burkholderiaceae bacterium]